MNVSAKTIIALILAFIALAIGPITYVNYAKQIKEHERTTEQCAQEQANARLPWCMFHDLTPKPPVSIWLKQWASSSSPAMLILALMYITPILWRFFLDRLRDIARALRGMD